ncbi:lipase/acyltransferase domain-containing protein [Actinomadura chibensis]|uniref:lipase/acyltransferase domain-containing protein n=1 Tax=Actinomadura chibensis TaxID=392828 RepID=UPI000835661F|nr:alpha/beta hydrolase [Actinomadura chibensis]
MRKREFYYPAGAAGAKPAPRSVPHLLVFVPGIGGSELRAADGTLIWGLSGEMVDKPVRVVERLAGPSTGLFDPGHDDGVRPGGLMAVPIPGLTRKLGAYQSVRTMLAANFVLREHNYTEFCYDWRRPVEYSAELLAKEIEGRLRALRRRRPGAKVVIIAHSMGGLVARHYLQALDGAADCERVITHGTPFRGSVKALDYLVNGPKLGPVRFRPLAAAMRRVPALYELLPIYRTVVDRRNPVPLPAQRVVDVVEALGLEPEQVERVRRSREFLRALNEPHERARRLQPLVGYGVGTAQQAELYDGRLVVSERADLLPGEYSVSGGDGTVPALSARPGGAKNVTVRYDNQSHMGMVTGKSPLKKLWFAVHEVLDDLLTHDPALGPRTPSGLDRGVPEHQAAVYATVADCYRADRPVVITGRVREWAKGRPLFARLDTIGRVQELRIAEDGAFTADFGDLEEGLYDLAFADAPAEPALLSDVIEVA